MKIQLIYMIRNFKKFNRQSMRNRLRFRIKKISRISQMISFYLPITKHILLLLYEVHGISFFTLNFGAGWLVLGRIGCFYKPRRRFHRHGTLEFDYALWFGDLFALSVRCEYFKTYSNEKSYRSTKWGVPFPHFFGEFGDIPRPLSMTLFEVTLKW